jgi:betaine lipid synthase
MASHGGNIMPQEFGPKMLFAGLASVVLFALGLSKLSNKSNAPQSDENPGLFRSLLLFCYSCFLKPHGGDAKGDQQDALESFYSSQAGVYDVTRKTLLKGREDMLALVAAQLQFKGEKNSKKAEEPVRKRVWVDVCPPPHPHPPCSPLLVPSVAHVLTCSGRRRNRVEH